MFCYLSCHSCCCRCDQQGDEGRRVTVQRQSLCVCVWLWTPMRDSWERNSQEFTGIRNFSMTRNTFNELCDAIEVWGWSQMSPLVSQLGHVTPYITSADV